MPVGFLVYFRIIGYYMKKTETKKIQIKDGQILFFYLLLFFGVASVIALMQPMCDTPPWYGNPPDEPSRFKVAQFICKYGKLPNGFDPEIRIPGYGISYGFYTMLPYIVQGFAMRFVSLFTSSQLHLLYAARFVNVICGTVMAAFVYGTAGRLFSDRRFKWLFCIAVMYLPQSLFVHTYVNTDSMSMMSSAIIFYALVRAYQSDFSVKNCLILSVGIIICALSYYNAYGCILCSILLFVGFYVYRNKESGKLSFDFKMMWKRGGLIAAVVLLGIGWYFIRNAVLYDGDFIGMKTLRLCGEMYGDPSVQPYRNSYAVQGISLFTMLKERNFFEGLFISFVAALGSMSIYGNIWMYRFYKAFFLVGILSFVLLREKITDRNRKARKIYFHLNMFLWIVIPLILIIDYAYTYDYQNQGRYVMPALIPLMYYAVEGLRRLAGLGWMPDKWGKLKKGVKITADIAVYVAIAAVVFFLIHTVFFCAVPIYRTILSVPGGNLLEPILY